MIVTAVTLGFIAIAAFVINKKRPKPDTFAFADAGLSICEWKIKNL